MTGRPRYTSNTVFDSFPWPQSATIKQISKVAKASSELRALRRQLMVKHNLSLRELYRSLENPGTHPIKDAQKFLDDAVCQAYGLAVSKNPLEFLLELNEELVLAESAGHPVIGPGLPPIVKEPKKFITLDCVRMP